MKTTPLSLGPLMVDLEGLTLTDAERALLLEPSVGGVILFARNFQNPEQLIELTEQIHQLRKPKLIIAVDQEGGRVQRFKEGFTLLPAPNRFQRWYNQHPKSALATAREIGWLMASELLACGVDMSFAPVLDLNYGTSDVVTSRAYHRKPDAVSQLARETVIGMREAGMQAVGKHFPGHGYIKADSHIANPVDDRPYRDLKMADLIPFERLIRAGIAGIMPSHVIYSQIDQQPAGYSVTWLQKILRQQLRFEGVIFSDDLSMKAADAEPDCLQRAFRALSAGCDMVMACNHTDRLPRLAQALNDYEFEPASQMRLSRLHGRPVLDWQTLSDNSRWQKAQQAAHQLIQDRQNHLQL